MKISKMTVNIMYVDIFTTTIVATQEDKTI